MPPEDEQYESDESELEAALSAPKALSPAPVDAGADYADDAELDAALSVPNDISEQVSAAVKPAKVIEMPVQHIDGKVPKTESHWYDRFKPNGEALAHGAASGATLNWGEEGASALSSLLSPMPGVIPGGGARDPEGYTREYAAGSQYADMRDGLEAENKTLRSENPGSYFAGEVLGAAPAAIATSAAAPVSAGARGVANLLAPAAVQGAVAGSGADVENRGRGAAIGGATGVAMAGAMHGLGTGLQATAKNAVDESNRLITQTFMTPAQRAAYEKAHGLDSIRQLGSDARDAGLFKTAILPPRAATVAKRANEVMSSAGDGITGFEDDLTKQGINPDVQVRPIVDDLTSLADETRAIPALGADGMANRFKDQAALLEQPGTVSVSGKIERPPALPPSPPVMPPPAPAGPVQLDMNLPRAMPTKQLDLGLEPGQAPRPAPMQMEMDLPRQQPSQQLDLGLEPMQAKLPLPPAIAPKLNGRPLSPTPGSPSLETAGGWPAAAPQRPLSGGAAQEPMFLGTEPARPPAAPPAPPAPEQLAMQLPDRQIPLPLENPAPRPFAPQARPAQQMNLPIQQELPLPRPAPPPLPPPAPVPEQVGLGRGTQPELSTPLPDTEASIAREAMPFSEASALKRFLGKQINWDKNPRSQQVDLGTDEARKTTWKGVAQQIDKALAGDTRIDPTKLAQYSQDKKNFSTAATAFDPAVNMMEREGEMGLGARDLMFATAFGGGNPLTGGLTAMANKKAAGAVPAMGSSNLRRYAGAVGGTQVLSNKPSGPLGKVGLAPLLKAGARVSPVTEARMMLPEGTPDSEVRQQANDDVKKQLQELQPSRPK